MENFTLEELVSQDELLEPEGGIRLQGYACYPAENSFFITDSKPGEEINYLIKCSIKDHVLSDAKVDILTYSKLYHNEHAKKLIRPIEVNAMVFRPLNNGSGRLFPQLQRITKLEVKSYE